MPGTRLLNASWLLCAIAIVLAGCSTSNDQSETTPAPESAEFVGTPAERLSAMKNCLERRGWSVQLGDQGGISIDLGGRTSDEYYEDQAECSDEIGSPPMSSLSESELRDRYEWRVEQYECLVENDLAAEERMSFETFVDGYGRTGRATWDPIAPLVEDPEAVDQANTLCPYSTSEW